MTCCCNTTEEQRQNRLITQNLEQDRRKIKNTIKLLLLGAGDSGKSTIAKQMRIIHLDGFTEDERMGYKTTIANNILTAMRTLIHQANKFSYKLSTGNETRAQAIVSIPRDQEPAVTKEVAEAVTSLWQDPAIKKTFERSAEYQLNDSTQYYFENIQRISAPNYSPNEQDVLRSRVKTTGVLETVFEVEDILVVDNVLREGSGFTATNTTNTQYIVRSETRINDILLQCFEDVTAIIFCAAMSEYDLKLYEDNETNRMHESLQLFKDLCTTKWFANTSFILFLNKIDIFKEKITRIPLTVAFPDYPGPQTYEATSSYIKDRFMEMNENNRKTIYSHMTCATDTTNIIVVFNAVRNIILDEIFKNTGLQQ